MTREEILKELEQQRKLLSNYEELEVDMEDDAAYIARGNGFCDAKYSHFSQCQFIHGDKPP